MQPTLSATDHGKSLPPHRPGGPRLYITHVALSLDCGGLERVVLDLVRYGSKAGHHISVLCVDKPGMMAPQIQRIGARVICLNKPPGLHWKTTEAVMAALAILQPEVIHTHQLAALLYAAPAAAKAGIRVVHTEHSNHLARAANWLRRWRYRMLLGWSGRSAGRFCCVSSDIARAVTRMGILPRLNVYVVPNGIHAVHDVSPGDGLQVRANLGIPPNAPVIGTVGRLHPVKRQDLLLRSFSDLLRIIPRAHLVIVGDGVAHQELSTLAAKLCITERVHFMGYRPDPTPFLNIMDVFALTSHWEGMPLSVLEAWASGVPVVASAVGGIPELVRHGENGLLFPNGDKSVLTASLEELLKDRRRRESLGDAGRAEVNERYTVERMTSAYEEHYRCLLGH